MTKLKAIIPAILAFFIAGTLAYGVTLSSSPSGFSKIVVQTFCASGCTTTCAGASCGTYTPSAGMVYVTFECQGSGGGGGGVTQSTAGQIWGAAGGSGGGYARLTATAGTVGASQSISVGIGGTAGSTAGGNGGDGNDSSVGTLCIGRAGKGGGGATSAAGSNGGGVSAAGTGDVQMPGGQGFNGMGSSIVTVTSQAGNGGNAVLGNGSRGTAGAGVVGNVYGGGASGALSTNNSAAALGGVGGAGIVIATEYIR